MRSIGEKGLIIITGASKGIGRAIFERLTSVGNDVFCLSRSNNNLNPNFIECDVSNYNSVKNASLKIKKLNKKISVFINAAGIASLNLAVTTNLSTVENIIKTNLMGTIFCCQLFSPIMIRQRSGLFINFSTIAVPLALKGESIYAASKAGVETFSKVFAREMSDFNVRVNCIAPGPIKTDLLNGISEDQISKIVNRQIIKKIFDKSDICDLIELLIDKKSNSLSGHIFNVGGV